MFSDFYLTYMVTKISAPIKSKSIEKKNPNKVETEAKLIRFASVNEKPDVVCLLFIDATQYI